MAPFESRLHPDSGSFQAHFQAQRTGMLALIDGLRAPGQRAIDASAPAAARFARRGALLPATRAVPAPVSGPVLATMHGDHARNPGTITPCGAVRRGALLRTSLDSLEMAMRYPREHHEPTASIRRFIAAGIDPFVDEWGADAIFPAHEPFKKMGRPGFPG